MRVQYYDVARLSGDAEDALGVRFALFPELLQSSDIVTLHVPLDKSTHKLIGAHELGLMKPSAILINTCRGPVVDEDALYDALISERIHGAGLDVMVEEPPAPEHKLFTLPNIILTPHLAGPSWENWKKAFRNFVRQHRTRRSRREATVGHPRVARLSPAPQSFACPGSTGPSAIPLPSALTTVFAMATRANHFSRSRGSWSATDRYGGTASSGAGSWSAHSAYGGSASGGGGSWSATNRYGGTAYGGAAYHGGYYGGGYGGYHGAYYCGTTVVTPGYTGAGVAAGAVAGAAVGAAATSAAYAAASNNYYPPPYYAPPPW
jgi:hypothetical protein